ncbi:MAG: HAD family hydrolase [Flavihumibacter sp.]
MIKLIVTDLDGTLLNDRHEVPERFWQIVPCLFNKGIKVALATGRPHFSIVEKFRKILHEVYSISDNGALILQGGREVLSKPLPKHEIEALVLAARPLVQAWPILCGKDVWYLENKDDALLESISVYHKNFEIVDDLTKVKAAILKMSVCDLGGANKTAIRITGSLRDPKVAVGGAIWLDVTRRTPIKGKLYRCCNS